MPLDLLSHWLDIGLSLAFCYCFGSITYNLYFNPLAKYPGPFLAKISTFPSFYYSITGYRHIWIWQCHQIYGNTFRFRPNGVVINSPIAYRSIYSNKANVKKAVWYVITARKNNDFSTLSTIYHSPFAGIWVWMKPRGINYLFDFKKPKAIQQFHNFVDESVSSRRLLEENQQKYDAEDKDIRKDIFHYLFHADDQETGMPAYTENELNAEANFLFIAGSDTTATAMCSIFFYLPRHPQVYRKLTQEIRSTFNSADEIHGGTVSSCRYLRACIDEAMRMTPVAPSELPREVLPGGLKLGNDFFPPGTLIGSAGWSLMHSEDAFGDPWVYRPERWIADEENGVSIDDVSRAQAAFIPFSTGPSNCLGQKLAMLEMMLTVGRTLYVMDLKAPSGDSLGAGAPNLGWGRRDKNVFQVRDAYLSLRDGPMVQFKRRET